MITKHPEGFTAEEFAALTLEQQAAAWQRSIDASRAGMKTLDRLEADYEWWRDRYLRQIADAEKQRDACLGKR